jgi:hypothetical protein
VPTQIFGKIVETEQEEGGSFGPDEIAVMTAAFDQIQRDLKPKDRLTVETIAKLVIALVRNGERDPERLRQRVIGKRRPEAYTALVGDLDLDWPDAFVDQRVLVGFHLELAHLLIVEFLENSLEANIRGRIVRVLAPFLRQQKQHRAGVRIAGLARQREALRRRLAKFVGAIRHGQRCLNQEWYAAIKLPCRIGSPAEAVENGRASAPKFRPEAD